MYTQRRLTAIADVVKHYSMSVSEFFTFWGQCMRDGFGFAWDTFGTFDIVCGLIAGICYWLKKSHQHRWEMKWEPLVRKWASIVIAATFLASMLFIAPFLQYNQSATAAQTSDRSAVTWSNECVSLRDQSDRAKEMKAEQERAKEAKRIADLEESARERDKMIIAAATNAEESPRVAMLQAIAESPPRIPPRNPGEPFDLKSRDTAFDEFLSTVDAQRALDRIKSKREGAIWLTNSAPIFRYFMVNLHADLNDVAVSNGDTVTWNYKGTPESVDPGDFAFVKLECNSNWLFNMSFKGNSGDQTLDIWCGEMSAAIEVNESSGDMEVRLDIGGSKGRVLTKDCRISDYKTNVDMLISYLIPAQNRRVPIKNVKK